MSKAWIGALTGATVVVALAACGGGGSDSGSSGNAGNGTNGGGNGNGASAPVAASAPAASAPVSIPQSTLANVQPITVTTAPGLTRNMLTTSVTVCAPGTSNCATIDNIQVDTGSHGLRVLASALPASMSLGAVTPGTSSGGSSNTGTTSAECAVFGGGFTWGTVRLADVRMAGQLAGSVPIQLIADPAVPTTPADCAATGSPMQSSTALHSNGILGVGLFAADCGSGCANAALPRWYYACTDGTCAASAQPVASQVTNPVSRFALDNNGVVIDLPDVPDAGAVSVTGSMIFGIDTQSNNTVGATVLKANSQSGFVTTTIDGTNFTRSYIDSGSNAVFFSSADLTQCGYWYCPASPQTKSASVAGSDGAARPVTFTVANSRNLFSSVNYAFDNLAGIASNSFGWGLPFFFGRRVFTAIASRATTAGSGPYFAF